MENKEIVLILALHIDDILVSGNETVSEELLNVLNSHFSTRNLGEPELQLECAVERDLEKGTIKVSRPTMFDTFPARFDVKHSSNIPAPPVAERGPTIGDGIVTDRFFRQVVGGVMWPVGKTRPDIADAAQLRLATGTIHARVTGWR